jgi:DUF1680 family protein
MDARAILSRIAKSMRSIIACIFLAALSCLPGGISASEAQAPNSLTPVPIQQVTIRDAFWSPKIKVWREVTIPDCFDKFEQDRGGAINNFDHVRDGKSDCHAGPPWYDGLIYEMIRGASDFMAAQPDLTLEKRVDGYITRIAAAQAKDPNGYLNTWTELEHPSQRWGLNGGNDGYQHEIYNIGALSDAGMHYYLATGKTSLLEAGLKLANYTCDSVGPAPKLELIPNHAIIEEVFANLYVFLQQHPELKKQIPFAVDERRYLDLAQYWIEARGHARKDQQSYGAYNQDDKPVFDQSAVEGHAVRCMLMCAGLTTLAGINGRDDYRNSAIRLWQNLAGKKMYLTGGVGATPEGEAFGDDYFLPNDGYLETCGAAGAGFFDRDLNLLTADARYADELERELYNGALAGVSLAGNAYTYVNPLQSDRGNSRWAWHPCPCCPPMFLKIMGALPGYIYAQDARDIYVNLFIGSRVTLKLGGQKVVLTQTTEYPWKGDVTIAVAPEKAGEFGLNIRVPGWCQGTNSPDDLYQIPHRPAGGAAHLKINGKEVKDLEIANGYAKLHRRWKTGDTVELSLAMPVQQVKANASVAADQGRVALMRGPIVYCFEAADNGASVQNFAIPAGAQFTTAYCSNLLGGVTILAGAATALLQDKNDPVMRVPLNITAIPYYANANRGTCAMQVWMPDNESACRPQKQD